MRLITASFAAEGSKRTYERGSTDSNMPMSLGIPSLTIPRVGASARAHSLDERIDTEPESNHGVKKTVLAVAGAQ
ncbi:hypothetical protein HPT29_015555 [Microvirga terrae]|uniref:M20/M25/M40 family metallo-hydrolase n=1 Tax=Microvirga terrae TaxID=2740529 RepID=A0ABY5RNJ5_9HYPH|nr:MULTISPECIES: hypothetical protein [Microvirga]MBQ0823852.1 hypothetical protein [Microvirga sp. HBU67558]UVF17931.1 hypothetical protein HPT29_015555 [Microvirga terrae]